MSYRALALVAAIAALPFLLQPAPAAATSCPPGGLTVTSAADDGGSGTLRTVLSAALAANLPICFAIGSGPQTIALTSQLFINAPVTIDGTTQPGFSSTSGPLIALDGTGGSGNGLTITGSGTVIRGLTIKNFSGAGVYVSGSGNQIGDNPPNGNVIVNNAGSGVQLSAMGANNNTVRGNNIGVSAAGIRATNLGYGVWLQSGAHDNTVIDNVIASGSKGVYLTTGSTTRNVIQGNYIGTDRSRTADLGVTDASVQVDNASNNTIGPSNTIAFGTLAGIQLTSGSGNRVTRNSIFSNGGLNGLGIDIPSAGRTSGYPTITSASNADASSTAVQGSLSGSAGFTIELFSNGICGPAGRDAITYLSSTTTDGSGNFAASISPAVGAGMSIVATATDGSGNTSEISGCATVSSGGCPGGAPVHIVDVQDFSILLKSFNKGPGDTGYDPLANWDSDPLGKIDIVDFSVLLSRFGRSCTG